MQHGTQLLWWFKPRETCLKVTDPDHSLLFHSSIQEILCLWAPRVYFARLFFPLFAPFDSCPPAASLYPELSSLELTLISEVVLQPSVESIFFFFYPEPWTSVNKHCGGVLVTVTGCVEKHNTAVLSSLQSSPGLINLNCPSSKAYKMGKQESLSNQNEREHFRE